MFKTIEDNAESVVTEKKSKFIANIFKVSSVNEAEEIIEKIRKKYYDARHHCYAYRIQNEEGTTEKQSDDGEPSGTAGAPMLNILKRQELTNVIVVVTRYFGGILLGTGGLVRAYSEAVKQAINSVKIVEKEKGYLLEVINDYEEQKEFEHFCEKHYIRIVSKEYTDKIKYLIEMSENKYEEICQKKSTKNFHNFTYKIIENRNVSIMK